MAERLSIKDMLAAARKGGAVKPAGESAAVEAEIQAEAPAAEVVEVEAATAPVAAKVAAAPLDRPLTMKEKLAAARSGGAAAPAAAAAPVVAKVAAPAAEVAVAAVPAAPAPTAESLGRPLTMKEKLAAARGNAAPAPAAAAGAKPAAAKGAAPAVAAKAATRELPPLDKITDPRDLAEALRRAGAEKDKVAKAAAAAKAASAAGATPANAVAAAKASAAKKLESKTIPPKPTKEGTAAATTAPPGHPPAPAPTGRRPFLWGMGIGAIVVTGWANFTFALTAQTLACVRFMFPNVLAEPPSTIKVGLASDFEPEQVNDRWKAEWGFWIVRSTAYDGEDKIYAIQSVCTHLGCPPNWLSAEAKFKCPCHGSGFYISGVNFEGPAPRPLERFKVAVNDAGVIVVDKAQKFQEELKQWSDADSFIVA